MNNKCFYNHGRCIDSFGWRQVLSSAIKVLFKHSQGLLPLRNAIAPDGQDSVWCVPVQCFGTKLRDVYRLKKRDLSADINLHVLGYSDERVRFLLPVDNSFHQHTQG